MSQDGYLQTSIYISEEDREMVATLQKRTGLSRSALVRHALRRMYEDEPGNRQVRLLEIADELRSLA